MGLYFLLREPQLAPLYKGLWSAYFLGMEFHTEESYSFRNENVWHCDTPLGKSSKPAEIVAEGEGNLEGILKHKDD